jgi:hypothetical protein
MGYKSLLKFGTDPYKSAAFGEKLSSSKIGLFCKEELNKNRFIVCGFRNLGAGASKAAFYAPKAFR